MREAAQALLATRFVPSALADHRLCLNRRQTCGYRRQLATGRTTGSQERLRPVRRHANGVRRSIVIVVEAGPAQVILVTGRSCGTGARSSAGRSGSLSSVSQTKTARESWTSMRKSSTTESSFTCRSARSSSRASRSGFISAAKVSATLGRSGRPQQVAMPLLPPDQDANAVRVAGLAVRTGNCASSDGRVTGRNWCRPSWGRRRRGNGRTSRAGRATRCSARARARRGPWRPGRRARAGSAARTPGR
jgi:hypothetical protein